VENIFDSRGDISVNLGSLTYVSSCGTVNILAYELFSNRSLSQQIYERKKGSCCNMSCW